MHASLIDLLAWLQLVLHGTGWGGLFLSERQRRMSYHVMSCHVTWQHTILAKAFRPKEYPPCRIFPVHRSWEGGADTHSVTIS
jgi:hypothetical protein